jgi:hypothetical protein
MFSLSFKAVSILLWCLYHCRVRMISLHLFICRDSIAELLEAIPGMFTQPQPAESIGGAALFGALQVLKGCGGKITMFLASVPNTGMMAVKV